jgi:branched-chain amino acid transport system permease protein
VAIALDAASAEIFGNNPRQIAPFLSPQPIFIGSVPVDRTYIVLAVTAGILAAILEIVFRSTTFGRNLRATQGDAEGVALLGLNVKAVITGVFAISGLIAALSGLLIAPIAFASPSVGTSLVLPAFAAIAIGGFGSFRGGIIGGLLVGLLNGVLPLYISPSAVDLLLFVVIVATLLVRPSGLFATSTSREL